MEILQTVTSKISFNCEEIESIDNCEKTIKNIINNMQEKGYTILRRNFKEMYITEYKISYLKEIVKTLHMMKTATEVSTQSRFQREE